MKTELRTLADRCCASPTADRCPSGPLLSPPVVAAWATTFRALADPTRLEILALLAAARGELCACDIESRFDLSQPTISHHLRLLKAAGLVSSERRGTWVFYTLETGTLRRVAALCRRLQGQEKDVNDKEA